MTSSPSAAWWRAAQVATLLTTVALLATLVFTPNTGLLLLWDVAIPILPAVFLVQPMVWRNLCPLATLSMLTNRREGGVRLDNGRIPVAGTIGIVLLALMVPARRFLFNTDGPLLAATVVGVAVLAMALGAVFDKRAGFCSAICPVLPVERLYGQDPLLGVSNPRCSPCTLCVTRGCIDIAHTKSVAQTLGRERQSHAWLQTHFGAFAAAFPGFVLGYNLTTDGSLASAGAVYATVALASGASYVATQLLVRAFRLGWNTTMRILGTTAFVLYYWFAAATISRHLGLAAWAPGVIRLGSLILLALWFWRPSRRMAISYR